MKAFSTSLILIIKFYKYLISPLLPSNCRYLPTCSEYFIDCIKLNGPIQGFRFGLKRITKCHPIKFLGGSNGYDPAPNLKKRKR